jgi:hypothetical protein
MTGTVVLEAEEIGLQLAIGSGLIVGTVILSAAFAGVAVWAFDRLGPWATARRHRLRFVVLLLGLVLWVQLAATACVWIWALAYLWLGALEGLEPALYFALVSFTTIGFGDVVLDPDWRLLSAMSGANGLLMFGFYTAFLVEMMRRVHREQSQVRLSAD